MKSSKRNVLRAVTTLVVSLALSSGCASRSRQVKHTPEDSCWRVRIGLDVGSGSSKARSAVVDICRQRLVREMARASEVIGFKDHLSSRPQSSKSFAPEFMANSEARIGALVNSVREQTRAQLRNESKFNSLIEAPIEISGVATEAFRQAGNTAEFVERLKQNHQLNLIPIEQSKEGHLGFVGVMTALTLADPTSNFEPSKVVSWDIGGGSLQMVAYDGQGQWLGFGNRLASNPMRKFVVEQLKKRKAFTSDQQVVSPNPILSPKANPKHLQRETKELMDFTRSHVAREIKDLLKARWMNGKTLKIAGREVYGIGGVHNGILRFLRQLTGNSHLHELTPQLLEQALEQALVSDDARLIKDFQVKAEYASVIVSNMLLVKSVMDLLKLERITVLDVDNTYGVLVSPEFWSEKVTGDPAHRDLAL